MVYYEFIGAWRPVSLPTVVVVDISPHSTPLGKTPGSHTVGFSFGARESGLLIAR